MKKTSKTNPVSIHRPTTLALGDDALASVRGGARLANSPIDQGMKEAGEKPDIARGS